VLVVGGLALFANLSIAVADVAGAVEPSSLQALHVLSQELFFPLTVGVSVFLLGAGVAVRRTGLLPPWLGWAAIVFGAVWIFHRRVVEGEAARESEVVRAATVRRLYTYLISAIDHIGYGGFIGLVLWTIVASIMLAARKRRGPSRLGPRRGLLRRPDGWDSIARAHLLELREREPRRSLVLHVVCGAAGRRAARP